MNKAVTLNCTGSEVGTVTDGTSTASFSQFENFKLSAYGDSVSGGANTASMEIDGRAGNDTIIAGSAADSVYGGDGNDSLACGSGRDSLSGGAGSDTFDGGIGDDTLNGSAEADSLTGGDGNDTFMLIAGFGSDTLVGGETGETNGDTLDASSLDHGVTVTYTGSEAGTISDGTSTASFSQIETVNLSGYNDSLGGASSTTAPNVNTHSGNDTITGSTGNDTLVAGDATYSNGSGSLNWSGVGANGTSVAGGFTQDTGGIRVTGSWHNDGIGTSATVDTADQIYLAPGETQSSTSSLWMQGKGAGANSTTTLNFATVPGSGTDGTVSNVTFRIEDIDQSTWQDKVTVLAYDANGNGCRSR